MLHSQVLPSLSPKGKSRKEEMGRKEWQTTLFSNIKYVKWMKIKWKKEKSRGKLTLQNFQRERVKSETFPLYSHDSASSIPLCIPRNFLSHRFKWKWMLHRTAGWRGCRIFLLCRISSQFKFSSEKNGKEGNGSTSREIPSDASRASSIASVCECFCVLWVLCTSVDVSHPFCVRSPLYLLEWRWIRELLRWVSSSYSGDGKTSPLSISSFILHLTQFFHLSCEGGERQSSLRRV